MTLLVCGGESEPDGSRFPPLLVNEFPLDISIPDLNGSFMFSLSRARVRALSRNIRLCPTVTEFSLAVSIRGPNDEVIRLDESPFFDLVQGDPPRMLLIARSQTSNFELTVLSGNQHREIESLRWHVRATDLRRMIDRESAVPGRATGIVSMADVVATQL